jgi:hypothetical protein
VLWACMEPTRGPETADAPPLLVSSGALRALDRFSTPRWLWRTVGCLVLGGQAIVRIARGGGGGKEGRNEGETSVFVF